MVFIVAVDAQSTELGWLDLKVLMMGLFDT